MDHWWPRLEPLDVPTPETAQVDCHVPDHEDSLPIGRPTVEDVRAAIATVGGPPAFIRTDQTSAKHQFEDGAHLDDVDAEQINRAIARLRDQHGMAFGMPTPTHYYVREFLALEHTFRAFGSTPIAAELRFFLLDGDVHDSGFYWPREAIKCPDRNDWLRGHAKIAARARSEAGRALDYACRVADEFDDGYWSCDFALEDGTWYCIDMAPGEISWHPESVDRLVEDPRLLTSSTP